HTPLWRRGLNDELNCNACGLYCKLVSRLCSINVRVRNRCVQAMERGDAVVYSLSLTGSAQCYNYHTTATPLWRKDEEGKTVCNA
ncbi:hypothetical protein P692DRAFT_201724634, partial [Suillus brevipes Sb2]